MCGRLTLGRDIGYCFTTSVSHGVEYYFPRLWGTDISDAIFPFSISPIKPAATGNGFDV